MSQQYGNPPHNPYLYQQHHSGPPPPQWQRPPPPQQPYPPGPYHAGWPQDTRTHTPPPSSYPMPPNSYNPNTFGPISPSTHQPPPQNYDQFQPPQVGPDTARWGVKYNHNQQHGNYPSQPVHDLHAPPALPPRPPSTNPPAVEPPPKPEDLSNPSDRRPQPKPGGQSWRESFLEQSLAQDVIPPPPPPRPAGYQTQPTPAQHHHADFPHEQYLDRPPSNSHEPRGQHGYSQSTASFQHGNQQDHPPQPTYPKWNRSGYEEQQPLVSPEEKQHPHWNSGGSRPPGQAYQEAPDTQQQGQGHLLSGSGYQPQSPQHFGANGPAPGGWDRFTPVDAAVPFASELPSTTAVPNHGVIPVMAGNLGTPTHHNSVSSNSSTSQVRLSQNQNFPSRTPGPPPTTHTVPGSDLPAAASNTAKPLNEHPFHELDPAAAVDGLRRPDTSSSNGESEGGIRHASTIDSVIQAWNTAPAPLSTGGSAKTSSPRPTSREHERPVSPQSPHMEPAVEGAAPSVKRYSQESITTARSADMFKDIDDDYHSSLIRFARTLRMESSAPAPEEKYKIFQAFVQKELRIRQALYEIDPEPPHSRSPSQSKRKAPMPTVQEADVPQGDDSPPVQANLAAWPPSTPRPSAPAFSAPPPAYSAPAPASLLAKSPSQIKRKALRSPSVDSSTSPKRTDSTASQPAAQAFPAATVGSAAGGQPDAVKATTPVPTLTLWQRETTGGSPTTATSDGSAAVGQPDPAKATTAVPTLTPWQREMTVASPTTAASPDVPKEPSPAPRPGHLKAKSDAREPSPPPPPGHLQAKSDAREPLALSTSIPPRSGTPKINRTATPGSMDGSHVVVNQDEDDAEYSPGGRPRLSKPKSMMDMGQTAPSLPSYPVQPISPSSNAPMVIADYELKPPRTPTPVSTGEAPPVPGKVPAGPLRSPVKFEPARPVYTPFRYNEGPATLPPDRPADVAYSELRNSAAESGRVLRPESTVASPGAVSSIQPPINSRREHQETFLGLIRSQSKLFRGSRPTSSIAQLRVGTPINAVAEHPLTEAVSDLRNLLPKRIPDDGHLHDKITGLRNRAASVPDEFGYIRDSVIKWDRSNREIRTQQEKERSTRQEESEGRFEELFNNNEISYAEINTMEADYKLEEAKRAYQEDQQELQSFVDAIYTPVTQRLQGEISQLQPLFVLASDLLDLKSDSGSHFLDIGGDRVQMSAAMETVLFVFRKLEIRHQKLAEAEVERERRRKKLELNVLYVNGNMAGVKKLEQEFTVAERMQVLHEAQSRNVRANQLMDIFDRATARGLGDNQTYVDDVLARIRKVKQVILSDEPLPTEGLYEPEGARATLDAAQVALDHVLADSRTILTTSNTADAILNEADFAVSMAEARTSHADAAMFRKLDDDKSSEDRKILEEMIVRMDSMAKGPAEATILIQEVVAKIGDDEMHQERIRKALEEAKKRNAFKEAP